MKEDQVAAAERTVDTVTLEINTLHRQAQQMMLGYVIEIGKRLLEVKELVPYGSWGAYLAERTPYSQSTANNFMKIYQEYGDENLSLFEKGTKSQTFGKLSYTQALALLALPASEREAFAEENQIEAMSSRQLQEAIRERNLAREEAQRLKTAAWELEEAKASLAHAERSRAKMEEDMKLLNQRLKDMAEETAQQREELQTLRDKPVEVAVMEADPAELDKARQEGRSQARKEAADQIAQSAAALEEAREKEKAARAKLEAMQQAVEEADRRAEAAQKAASAAGSKELGAFQALFDQAQSLVNKMAAVRQTVDAATAEKLGKAMLALAEAIQKRMEETGK